MRDSIFTFAEEASLTIHNIRNNLAVVKLNLEKMRDDCQEACSLMQVSPENWTAGHAKQATETFADHYKRLGRLLARMDRTAEIIKHQQGSFSKIIQLEEVFLDRLIAEVIETALTAANQIIDVDYQLDLPVAPLLNRLRIYQILNNTIQNSIESIERGNGTQQGKITVTACYQETDLIIEVADNGEGISQADLGKIGVIGFSRKENGHGLGVYYCRKIVQDECGGTMMVASAGKGKGATFKYRFPKARVGK